MSRLDLERCGFCGEIVLEIDGQDTSLPEWMAFISEHGDKAHLTCLSASGEFKMWSDAMMEHSATVRGLQVLDYADIATCYSDRGKWFHFSGQGVDCTLGVESTISVSDTDVTVYSRRSMWHIAEVPAVLKYYRHHMQPGKTFPLLELVELLGVTHRLRNPAILEDAVLGHQHETDEGLKSGFLTTWYRHRVEIPEVIREPVFAWLAKHGKKSRK